MRRCGDCAVERRIGILECFMRCHSFASGKALADTSELRGRRAACGQGADLRLEHEPNLHDLGRARRRCERRQRSARRLGEICAAADVSGDPAAGFELGQATSNRRSRQPEPLCQFAFCR